MKRIVLTAALAAVMGLSAPAFAQDANMDVYVGGTHLDPKGDFQVVDDRVYIHQAPLSAHLFLLLKAEGNNLDWMNTREKHYPVAVKAKGEGAAFREDAAYYIPGRAFLEKMGRPVKWDEKNRIAIFDFYDGSGLVYADITTEEKVPALSMTWRVPEDGIAGVEIREDKAEIRFVRKQTQEEIARIFRVPAELPDRNVYLLGESKGGYVAAKVAEKDPRKQGEAPSERNYAIDGVYSMLGSVKIAD